MYIEAQIFVRVLGILTCRKEKPQKRKCSRSCISDGCKHIVHVRNSGQVKLMLDFWSLKLRVLSYQKRKMVHPHDGVSIDFFSLSE